MQMLINRKLCGSSTTSLAAGTYAATWALRCLFLITPRSTSLTDGTPNPTSALNDCILAQQFLT